MDYATADDLLKMYGNRNPISNFIYDDQLAHQSQFRQLGMQEKGLTNRTKELENLFTEQNNPTKLLTNQAELTGKRIKNEQDSFTLDKTARTHESDVNQSLREAVTKLKDSDLKDLEREAQRLSYSTNPEERAIGLDLMQQHKDFVKIRATGVENRKTASQAQTHAKELEKYKAEQKAALEKQKSTSRKTTSKTVEEQLAGAKNYAQAQNILMTAAYEARASGDAELAQHFFTRANEIQAIKDRDAAAKLAGAPGPMLDPTTGAFASKPRPNEAPPLPLGGNPGNPRANPQGPQVGAIVRGYRYKGGDPANKSNWEKVN